MKFFGSHTLLMSQSFKGTDREYYETNGLDRRAFSVHKVQLGLARRRKKQKPSSQFSQVRLEDLTVPEKAPSNQLPDPEWLAHFLKAWLER